MVQGAIMNLLRIRLSILALGLGLALIPLLGAVPRPAAATFSTPTVNGVISAGEYGNHTNGANQQQSGGQTWYMTWDNTNLYIALTNVPDPGHGALIYLDKDPLTPINGGSNSNGTLVG